jgi:hypothetical protein
VTNTIYLLLPTAIKLYQRSRSPTIRKARRKREIVRKKGRGDEE